MSHKKHPRHICHSSVRCSPIFKILSLAHSARNLQ